MYTHIDRVPVCSERHAVHRVKACSALSAGHRMPSGAASTLQQGAPNAGASGGDIEAGCNRRCRSAVSSCAAARERP
jgi:hypothetical protein